MLVLWRRRLYLWYCAAAYFSFLLVFLGLSSSAWAESSSNAEYFQCGMMSYCKHFLRDPIHECGSYGFGDVPAWFDVSRIFAGLSVILLFSMTPVSFYLYFQDSNREDVVIFTMFGVVSGMVGLLSVILYAALRDTRNEVLFWGFSLFVCGHVFSIVFFLTLCVLNNWPKRKTPVKPFYM